MRSAQRFSDAEEAREARARRETCGQIGAVDDRQTKASRRHGMGGRGTVFMEGDLDAGDVRHAAQLCDELRGRMTVLAAVWTKQSHAESGAALCVRERPRSIA